MLDSASSQVSKQALSRARAWAIRYGGWLGLLLGAVGLLAAVDVGHVFPYPLYVVPPLYPDTQSVLRLRPYAKYTDVNVAAAVFGALTLVGSVVYLRARRNDRLFGATMAVVFFAGLSVLLSQGATAVSYVLGVRALEPVSPTFLVYLLRAVVWTALSFWIVRDLASEGAPPVPDGDGDGQAAASPVSRRTRLGHYLVDLSAVLLFSVAGVRGLVYGLGLEGAIRYSYGGTPIVLVGLAAVFYYTATEYAFGASPAKLLLGSRIVSTDTDGARALSLGKVLVRSLARFIPFEPFSFLGSRGWHDRVSETTVVHARPTGGPRGWRLFGIVAATAGLTVASIALAESAAQARRQRYADERHAFERERLRCRLQAPDRDDVYGLQTGFPSRSYYFRPLSADGDSVTGRLLDLGARYRPPLASAPDSFAARASAVVRTTLPIPAFVRARGAQTAIGQRWKVTGVQRLNAPEMVAYTSARSTYSSRGYTVDIDAYLIGAEIESVTTELVEGDGDWRAIVGAVPRDGATTRTPLTLHGEGVRRGHAYRLRFEVIDARGERHVFDGVGVDTDVTIARACPSDETKPSAR